MNKIKYKNLVSRSMWAFKFYIKISLKFVVFMKLFTQTNAFILKIVTDLQNLVSACN
jgi:hypothetical protein